MAILPIPLPDFETCGTASTKSTLRLQSGKIMWKQRQRVCNDRSFHDAGPCRADGRAGAGARVRPSSRHPSMATWLP